MERVAIRKWESVSHSGMERREAREVMKFVRVAAFLAGLNSVASIWIMKCISCSNSEGTLGISHISETMLSYFYLKQYGSCRTQFFVIKKFVNC
jgi:hypothetical protein